MIDNLKYVTYQTFPADTANSLQTVSNIKYFIRNGVSVELYFPLRNTESSDDLEELQNFYEINEDFQINGIIHPYAHGKVQYFPKIVFHLSHFLWSRKTVKELFKNNRDDYFFTRSDWIAYFLTKQGSKVVFECHQTSKLRSFILKNIYKFNNLKVIFLNENLKSFYSFVDNSIVLHNGVDSELFEDKVTETRKNTLLFLGNFSRFNQPRGLEEIISWFEEINSTDFNLEIVGCDKATYKVLTKKLSKNLNKNIIVSERVKRSDAIKKIQSAKVGLLINSPKNEHSHKYTSPLKYFEYLYGGLQIIAVDFPSHRKLPFSENINFFQAGDSYSFFNTLNSINLEHSLSSEELNSITIDARVKKIISLFS